MLPPRTKLRRQTKLDLLFLAGMESSLAMLDAPKPPTEECGVKGRSPKSTYGLTVCRPTIGSAVPRFDGAVVGRRADACRSRIGDERAGVGDARFFLIESACVLTRIPPRQGSDKSPRFQPVRSATKGSSRNLAARGVRAGSKTGNRGLSIGFRSFLEHRGEVRTRLMEFGSAVPQAQKRFDSFLVGKLKSRQIEYEGPRELTA